MSRQTTILILLFAGIAVLCTGFGGAVLWSVPSKQGEPNRLADLWCVHQQHQHQQLAGLKWRSRWFVGPMQVRTQSGNLAANAASPDLELLLPGFGCEGKIGIADDWEQLLVIKRAFTVLEMPRAGMPSVARVWSSFLGGGFVDVRLTWAEVNELPIVKYVDGGWIRVEFDQVQPVWREAS